MRTRFILEGKQNRRWYVPATVWDNPSVSAEEYLETLKELDPITYAQLANGDWTARRVGSMFKREWFEGKIVDSIPERCQMARYWDLAATDPDEKKQDDPDFTAGAKLALSKEGEWYICDVRNRQYKPKDVEDLVRVTSKLDGPNIKIGMEQEPGASGKSLVDYYARLILVGYDFKGIPSLKDKVTRAGPLAAACNNRHVYLVRGEWNDPFLDQLEAFPDVEHDDMVDAVTGAMAMLRPGTATGQSTVVKAQPYEREVGPEMSRRRLML